MEYRMKKKYSLVGIDGNAFSVMGYVSNAMKEAYRATKKPEFDKAAQNEYLAIATSSDYDHLLSISISQLNKVNEAIA